MAYEISYTDNTSDLAHCSFVDKIKTLATANGWVLERDVSSSGYREIILKGEGLSGTEEIFVGFKTYQSVPGDYYNILVGTFIGYVSGNTFETQPGAYITSICAHNLRIDYWLVCNAQRIAACLKVGTPIYETFYAGKFFQYGRPTQYPYPVVSGGSFFGQQAIRYSDTTRAAFFTNTGQTKLGLRNNAGWVNPKVYPIESTGVAVTHQLRDTNANYPLIPSELYDTNGVYGVLDGIYYVSGFNNVVENTVVISGVTYLVVQNIWRTGFADYIALRLD